MKVKDTLNKGIYEYYFNKGKEPIKDITSYLEEEGEIEIYDDWDGDDGKERVIIKREYFILKKKEDEVKTANALSETDMLHYLKEHYNSSCAITSFYCSMSFSFDFRDPKFKQILAYMKGGENDGK